MLLEVQSSKKHLHENIGAKQRSRLCIRFFKVNLQVFSLFFVIYIYIYIFILLHKENTLKKI